jgi:hypothetical protein
MLKIEKISPFVRLFSSLMFLLCHTVAGAVDIETFESQGFTAFPWQMGGAMPWAIHNTAPYTGGYCAGSGAIGHYEQSEIRLTLNVSVAGTVRFARRVSSEDGYDFLRFYVDGVERGRWSGEVPWGLSAFDVGAGVHVFSWRYEKDGGISLGQDRAWIDDVELPPFEIAVATLHESMGSSAIAARLFPNPATEYANIVFDLAANTSLSWEVLDLQGRRHQQDVIPDLPPGQQAMTIPVADLPKGAYVLCLQIGTHVIAIPFVKY